MPRPERAVIGARWPIEKPLGTLCQRTQYFQQPCAVAARDAVGVILKGLEPFGLIAAHGTDGAKFETAIPNHKAATTPVIDRLDSAILQRAMDEVVAAVGRQIEANRIGLTELKVGL